MKNITIEALAALPVYSLRNFDGSAYHLVQRGQVECETLTTTEGFNYGIVTINGEQHTFRMRDIGIKAKYVGIDSDGCVVAYGANVYASDFSGDTEINGDLICSIGYVLGNVHLDVYFENPILLEIVKVDSTNC
ncbi:hypothetical protein [Gibbsiella quercinecans]|uniref:hypothetical protein n=1 Tax=Gibbsiella quercinecans TaxID=929813 RepID=UPI00242EAF9F|nr:hypothetical protein [Gibbsiella quercinecans]